MNKIDVYQIDDIALDIAAATQGIATATALPDFLEGKYLLKAVVDWRIISSGTLRSHDIQLLTASISNSAPNGQDLRFGDLRYNKEAFSYYPSACLNPTLNLFMVRSTVEAWTLQARLCVSIFYTQEPMDYVTYKRQL